MSKRFIAYILGIILASVAFVSNAQAQISEIKKYEPSEPCSVLLGDTISWIGPEFYYEQMECGCQFVAEYFYGYTATGVMYVHIGQYFVLEARNNCPHYKRNDFFFGQRNLGNLSFYEYLEVRVLESLGCEPGVDISRPELFSSKGKCQIEWYVPRDIGDIEDLGDIEIGPVKHFPVDVEGFMTGTSTIELLRFNFNKWYRPCEGEPCCVAMIVPHVVYDPSDYDQERPIIKRADKKGIEVYADNKDCSGFLYGLGCEYKCEDIDYSFDENGVSHKIAAEEFKSFGVTISPNPNTGIFNIKVDRDVKNIQVVLTDMLGNIIIDKSQQLNSQDYDLSEISSGAYTLTVKNGNEVIGTKLIQITR